MYHLNLEEFLSETTTGQFILNSYRKRRQFNRSMRNQLIYIVISGMMNKNTIFSYKFRIDFEQLHTICEIRSLLTEYQKWETFFNTLRSVEHDSNISEYLSI